MLKLLFILVRAGEISALAAATYFWAQRVGWRDRMARRGSVVPRSPYDLPLQASIFTALFFMWAQHLLEGIESGFSTLQSVTLVGMLFCLVVIAARLVARIREVSE